MSPWQPDLGLPVSDDDDSDDDLYQPSLPTKPTGSTSTGEKRQSPPTPIPPHTQVPPQPNFPQPPKCTKSYMGYQKEHPKALMEPHVCPPRTIKPVIQKDSIYGTV